MPTLLVDANPSSRAQLATALAEGGDEMLHAGSTAEALAIVSACRQAGQRLDLIVVDGVDVCRRLKQIAELRAVPILVMTRDDDSIAAAFEAGAADCIGKPLRPRELSIRARAALEANRARQLQVTHERGLRKQTQDLEATKERLERLVCVDALTGVGNRRHLDAMLRAEWARVARAGQPLAAIMADIDFFHGYNERYGHPSGDRCLRQVAEALAASLRRPADFLGRYGGEEFLALLPGTTLGGAALVAERFRAAVEALVLPHDQSGCAPVVTISAGIAWASPPTGVPESVVIRADAALYVAKSEGRNRVSGAPERGVTPARPSPGGSWPSPEFVEPALAGRIPALLERKKADIPLLYTALLARDFDRIRFVARDLRHSAALNSLDGLARIAVRLERAARGADESAAAAGVADLDWYLDRVQVIYRHRTKPPTCG